MILSLLLGCNNGEIEKLEKKNQFLGSVVSLGNNFLDVFTSFGDMVGGVLGFNADTPKSKVGEYFNKVKETVEGTKDKLEKIVADMEKENNPNAAAVKTKVEELIKNKLSKIIAGSKTAFEAIGTEGPELIGNVAAQSKPAGVAGNNLEDLVKGIKGIVDVVLVGKGDPEAGDTNKAQDGSARSGGADAGILFASNNAGLESAAKKSATDAAKAVGAVTGADILQAIAKGESGEAATLAKNSAANGNAGNGKKDAVIAGGIALRAMAKNGKFANASDSDSGVVAPIVKGAAVSAVNKALGTLTIAIRKTIDAGLKTVKDAMKINVNEASSVTTEAKN